MKKSILLLTLLATLSLGSYSEPTQVMAQTPISPAGFGAVVPPELEEPCVPAEMDYKIWESLNQRQKERYRTRSMLYPLFDWPLENALHDGLILVNYVDNDNTTTIEDYMCNPHAYDGHNGTDMTLYNFRAMDRGMEVLAAAEGVVINTEYSKYDRNTVAPFPDNGNYVIVEHLDGTQAWYWHFRKNSVTVEAGEPVQRGQVLGLAGSSGHSSDAHLHFEVGEYVGPYSWRKRDPWHGTCNTEPSLWVDQEPYVGTAPIRVYDMGVFTEDAAGGDMSNIPSILFKEKMSQPVVMGAGEPYLGIWLQFQCQAGDVYTLEVRRPNSTVYASVVDIEVNYKLRYGWHYWYWHYAGNVQPSDYGTWTAQVIIDGSIAKQVHFEVGAATVYSPRFWPVAGRSFRTNGTVQEDVLSVSELGGPVTYSLLNAPDFVTLVDDVVTIGATSTQPYRSLYFQALATDAGGRQDTMWYHLVDPSKYPPGAVPDILLAVTGYDYGEIFVGNAINWEFEIFNFGQAELVIHEITSNRAEFAVTSPDFPQTLLPGEEINARVLFTPSTAGLITGQLSINSNDPDEPTVILPVRGKGIAPEIHVTPETVDETVVEGGAKTTKLTIANRGNYELTFQITEAIDWLDVDPSSGTVEQDGEQPVEVLCDATDLLPGDYVGDLSISSNDPLDPEVIVPISLGVEASRVIIAMPTISSLPGEMAYVSLGMDNQTWLAVSILIIEMEFGFDEHLLELIDVEAGERVQHMDTFQWSLLEPGLAALSIYDTGAEVIEPGTGAVSEISFILSVDAALGDISMITIMEIILIDENGDTLAVESVDGMISCGLKGDVNADGQVNIVDALLAINIILEILDPTDLQHWAANCNWDEVVNVLDVLGIVNVILGLGECVPGACKAEVTPEVVEFLESLEPYFSPENFNRFMAMLKGEIQVPDEYSLAQNYPNPFNPTTDIRYQIADSRLPIRTTMKIYNILGQEVRTLVDEQKEPGYYTISWDGRDAFGNHVASGIYFYHLTSGEFTATKRMILLK